MLQLAEISATAFLKFIVEMNVTEKPAFSHENKRHFVEVSHRMLFRLPSTKLAFTRLFIKCV